MHLLEHGHIEFYGTLSIQILCPLLLTVDVSSNSWMVANSVDPDQMPHS